MDHKNNDTLKIEEQKYQEIYHALWGIRPESFYHGFDSLIP